MRHLRGADSIILSVIGTAWLGWAWSAIDPLDLTVSYSLLVATVAISIRFILRRKQVDIFEPSFLFQLILIPTAVIPVGILIAKQSYSPGILHGLLAVIFALYFSLNLIQYFFSNRARTFQKRKISSTASPLFILLLALGWVWRFNAFNNGWLDGTLLGAQLDLRASSNLIGQLNGLATVALFGLCIFRVPALPYHTLWILVGAEIGWVLVTGSKAALIYALAPIALIYYKRGILSSKTLITSSVIVVFAAVLLFPIVEAYRVVVQSSYAATGSFSLPPSVSSSAATEASVSRIIGRKTMQNILDRIDWASFFGDLLSNEDVSRGRWKGRSYSPIFTWLIPRFIWPDKPKVSVGSWYGHHIRAWNSNSRSEGAITIWGDGYMNFGWTGALLAPCIFVFFVSLFYQLCHRYGPWGLLLLSVTFVRFFIGMEQNMAAPLVAIQQMTLLIIGLWIAHLVTNFTIRSPNNLWPLSS